MDAYTIATSLRLCTRPFRTDGPRHQYLEDLTGLKPATPLSNTAFIFVRIYRISLFPARDKDRYPSNSGRARTREREWRRGRRARRKGGEPQEFVVSLAGGPSTRKSEAVRASG